MESVAKLRAANKAGEHSNKRLVEQCLHSSWQELKINIEISTMKGLHRLPGPGLLAWSWRLTRKSNSFEGLYMGIGRKHDRAKCISSFVLKMGLKAKPAVSGLSPWPCVFIPPSLHSPGSRPVLPPSATVILKDETPTRGDVLPNNGFFI